MYSKSELKKYSDAAATIKSITSVYEEAAARRIKLIQVRLDRINEFLSSAADAYVNIKFGLVAEERKKKLPRRDIIVSTFRKPVKKGILVLISSHEQYYGNLITNVYQEWKADMEKTGFDGVVLGNTGRKLLEKDKFKPKSVEVHDLDDNNPDWKLVYTLANKLNDYSQIGIYFGKYKTVLTQVAAKEDIGHSMTVGQLQEIKRYLFETAGDSILAFFEKGVIAGLFHKKIYEAQIARYAARIKLLEIGQVAEKMSQVLTDIDKGKIKVRRNIANRKQLQLYTGLSLWNGRQR